MKYLLFIPSIIIICLGICEAQNDSWYPLEDECPDRYKPCNPTIKNINCDTSQDAMTVYKGMVQKNYSYVANLLVKRTNEQLQEIQTEYKSWSNELKYVLKDQFPKGNLKKLILDLIQPLNEFIFNDLINLSCSPNPGIELEILDHIGVLSNIGLANVPNITYGFGPLTQKFLETIVKGTRPLHTGPIGPIDLGKAVAWLQMSLTDNEVDPRILGNLILNNNDVNLHKVYDAYRKKKGHAYEEILFEHAKKLSTDYTDEALYYKAVVGMYKITKNRLEYFAERLHESLTKNNYNILDRIFITRREIDLGDIKNTFAKMYKNSLSKMITNKITDMDTNYKNALLLILDEKIN